jgi:excisionase family DNA binding protein
MTDITTTHRATPQTATPEPETPGWTAADIRALGLHVDVGTAAAIFGISRTTAYELIDRGEFPIPVLRLGTRYRIAVPAILTALGLPAEPSTAPGTGAVPPQGRDAESIHTEPPPAGEPRAGLDERPAESVDQPRESAARRPPVTPPSHPRTWSTHDGHRIDH